jgi:hypothetical protein
VAGPGTLIGGVVAVGVGEAAGVALEPVLEPQRQEAWSQSKARIFDLGTLAQLVAQGLLTQEAAHAEGLRNGYHPSRVDRAIQLALKAAPIAEILELWRRGLLGTPDPNNPPALVTHALAKAQIEPQYWKAITDLFFGRLDPAVIATAIQRGVMVAPFDLPYSLPAGVGNVAAFPVSNLSAEDQARAHGVTVEQLRVMTALVGLPLALDQAARGHFRGILKLDDFDRAVLEGNTRGEWGRAALEVSREILTAGQYAELQLRGYYDENTRKLNTAKHGMSGADSDLLYNVLGRSIAVHQVTTGLARGGKYPSVYADVPQPYRAAIQRSNIREEWVGLDYANRYTYPSWFALRALLTDGVFTEPEAAQLLLEIGWRPDLAEKVAKHYAPTGTASADPHVTKANTQLWNTAHASYKAEEATQADVVPALSLLGIDTASQQTILDRWNAERALIRKQLAPIDIRKAEQQGDINAATGVAWTMADALAALQARGWSPTEAQSYLNIPYKG